MEVAEAVALSMPQDYKVYSQVSCDDFFSTAHFKNMSDQLIYHAKNLGTGVHRLLYLTS